jgi:hypothetical protein
MKKLLVPLFTVALLIFTGCGHTNELANYNLQSQTFLFEYGVASGAQQVSVDFTTPLGTEKTLFSKGGFSAALDIAEAVGTAVSAIVSAETTEKLVNAIDVNEMAYYTSEGIENTLSRFYDIKSAASAEEPYNFIVETILTRCQLGSNETGVGVLVEATTRIIDKESANIVWEYEGENVVPLREGAYSFDRTVNTVSSVIGAAQLAGLSEEEIKASVDAAAAGVGALIAETLREDISEVRSK